MRMRRLDRALVALSDNKIAFHERSYSCVHNIAAYIDVTLHFCKMVYRLVHTFSALLSFFRSDITACSITVCVGLQRIS